MLPAALLWLAAVNLLTLVAFRRDKQQARRGQRRIPEGRLLLLAAAGGTPAACWARAKYRHKTRKQPFTARLHGIAAAQLLALAWAAWSVAT